MIRREEDGLQTWKLFPTHHRFRATTHACTLTLGSLLALSLVSCGGQDSSPVSSSGPVVSNPASLTALTLSGGRLNPAFDPSVTNYSTMFIGTNSLTLTPTAPNQTITVNGVPVASGSPSAPIALPPGSSTITILVTSSTGQTQAYIIAAHQLAQESYVKASNIGAGDEFGRVIAIDGNTLVVGAPLEDSDATGQSNNTAVNSGAVYVFTRTGTSWTQQAYIKASNTGTEDEFGSSVALKGDTLVVGAPREDSGATGVNGDQASSSASNSGAVYVFTRTGATWTQQAYIKASNPGAEDLFGFSVALSSDTLAVGALNEDSGATGVNGDQTSNSVGDSGAVYVFTRTGTSWTQQAYLKASNTGSGDWFGIAVALDGETLAVGANREDSISLNQGNNNAPDSGAVYVFRRSGVPATWAQEAYIKGSNTAAGDEFGRRVVLDGDTLAVGAYREDGNGLVDSGAVYVFRRDGIFWNEEAYLKASNAAANNRLGFSIALSGDTLVAGSSGEDSASTGVGGDQFTNPPAWASGAAYVFTRTGTTWTQQAYVKASNTGGAPTAQDSNGNELFGDQFGAAVALDGDTVVVGAYTEDSNGTESDNSAGNSGAVYVLR